MNRLQTSREIFQYSKTANTDGEDREILARVICPETPESRDRIIKASNSQNSISPASLLATDKIQRDIEQYSRSFRLYYDCRKNFYKNAGKPIDKTISIPAMAQALMAVVLQEPGTARARLSSLLKKDEDYKRVRKDDFPIEVYPAAIELSRPAEARSRTDATLSPEDRVNLKFYAAMCVAALACGAARPRPDQIADLAGATIDEALLDRAIALVKSVYQRLGGTALAAKGREFGEKVDIDAGRGSSSNRRHGLRDNYGRREENRRTLEG